MEKNSVKFDRRLYHKRHGFSECPENAASHVPIFREKKFF